MAKKFNSLEDVVSYIKNSCNPEIIDEIEREGLKTMEDVTRSQVKGWNEAIFQSIGTNIKTNDSLELSWQDNGGWYSLSPKTFGNRMYAPWALEHGKVWDFSAGSSPKNPIYKNPTTLEETSTEIIEKDSKEITRKILKRKGFGIG